jgi:hypothetical protein
MGLDQERVPTLLERRNQIAVVSNAGGPAHWMNAVTV